jgi:hypothetical protein
LICEYQQWPSHLALDYALKADEEQRFQLISDKEISFCDIDTSPLWLRDKEDRVKIKFHDELKSLTE